MKWTIFLIAVLSMAVIPCFSDEPNAPLNTDNNSIESRIIALELRIIELETRIAQLESRRPAAAPRPNPVPQAAPDLDALRLERSQKQIQDARDDIKIARASIRTMPYPPFPTTQEYLETATKIWKLYSEIEDSYQKIIRFAEKNPELKVDIVSVKKDLAICLNDKRQIEIEKERIKDWIQAHKNNVNYNRDRSITTSGRPK